MNASIAFPALREVEEPLGLFLRAGREDHKVIQQLLSEERVGMLGVVFDPSHCSFQEELRGELNQRKLDVILDTRMMELATPNGLTVARKKLPWAKQVPQVPSDFDSNEIGRISKSIVSFAQKNGFSAILAPTHYLSKGPMDEWFQVDRKLLISLRQALDDAGMKNTSIYYPLALPGRFLFEPGIRIRLKAAFSGLPIDALWLRIHPFGSDSGDITLRRYIHACRELHGMNIPLVAEKTGILGLALLAVGAVSGVESGIASGEKFDFLQFTRPMPEPTKHGKQQRVFISALGIYVDRKEATQFFSLPNTKQFACRDTHCCARGFEDMIDGNRRHFAYTRMVQIDELGKIPPSQRPSVFLQTFLRPTTNNLIRACGLTQLPAPLKKKLERHKRQQVGWAASLRSLNGRGIPSYSAPIGRRVHRLSATA